MSRPWQQRRNTAGAAQNLHVGDRDDDSHVSLYEQFPTVNYRQESERTPRYQKHSMHSWSRRHPISEPRYYKDSDLGIAALENIHSYRTARFGKERGSDFGDPLASSAGAMSQHGLYSTRACDHPPTIVNLNALPRLPPVKHGIYDTSFDSHGQGDVPRLESSEGSCSWSSAQDEYKIWKSCTARSSTSARPDSTGAFSTLETTHELNPSAMMQREPRTSLIKCLKSIEVYPGFRLRLRGAEETFEAIKHDAFVPTTCYSCSETIFCVHDAHYILCPDCRVVSPLDINDDSATIGGAGGVGLGFTCDQLLRWQDEILRNNSPARYAELL